MMRFAVVCFLLFTVAVAPVTAEDAAYEREENYVYRVLHGTGLIMDIWRPAGESNGMALIDVLSGAWHSGTAQLNDHINAGIFDVMCSRGYTVFMVRPGSRTKWTVEEMRDNLHYATRYIRLNADKFEIDPERVGMLGASAGGHLSLLTAMTAADGDPDAGNPLMRESAKIQAVAVFFPPTDFLNWGRGGDAEASAEGGGEALSAGRLRNVSDLLYGDGAERSLEELRDAAEAISPARMDVPEDMPPVLLIHGDADDIVPLQQSEAVMANFEQAGAAAELIVAPGKGHGWPTIREEVEIMADWFNSQLADE